MFIFHNTIYNSASQNNIHTTFIRMYTDTETPYFYLPNDLLFIDITDFHSAEIDLYDTVDHDLDTVDDDIHVTHNRTKKRSKRHRTKKDHRPRLMMMKTYQQKALHRRRRFQLVDACTFAAEQSKM
jgi:hypothetical protein